MCATALLSIVSWLFQWVTSGSGERDRINNITSISESNRGREREEENGEKLKEKRRGILSGKREWGRIKMEGKRYKEIRNEIGEGYHERGEYKIKKRGWWKIYIVEIMELEPCR